MQKDVLGHIDCPCCGEKNGMQFTPDKNGKPFGYCKSGCRVQLRIGGDKFRESLFAARHAWAGEKPVTVTDTPREGEAGMPAGAGGEKKPPASPVTVTAKPKAKAPAKPVPVPEPKPKASWLSHLGV